MIDWLVKIASKCLAVGEGALFKPPGKSMGGKGRKEDWTRRGLDGWIPQDLRQIAALAGSIYFWANSTTSVCLSICLWRCTLWLNVAVAKVSEQVNRKCHPRNMILQLSSPDPPTPTLSPQTSYPQKFHIWNSMISMLMMAIPDNGL